MKLPVSHLTSGMKLTRPIYGSNGEILLNRNVVLTAKYIMGLRQHGISVISVEGPYNDLVKMHPIMR